MRHRSWLVVVLIAVVGCSAGHPSDSVPAPPPAPIPAPVAPPASTTAPPVTAEPSTPVPVRIKLEKETAPLVMRLVDRGIHPSNESGQDRSWVVPPGEEEVFVCQGFTRITWEFDRDAREYERLVQVDGAVPDRISAAGRSLEVFFAEDAPASWHVWLDGIEGSGMRLIRSVQPTARLWYRQGEAPLLPWEGTELRASAGSLTLELQFDQPMWSGSLDRLFEKNPRVAFEATWLAPDRLELRFAEVPRRLEFNLEPLRAAQTKLPLYGPPLILSRSELAPYLERYHLATGRSERVAMVPPDVFAASLSPDKRFAVFQAWARRNDQGHKRWPTQVSLLDLQAGELRSVPLKGLGLHWLADSTLVDYGNGWSDGAGWSAWNPERGGEPTAHPEKLDQGAVSPDGRTAAALKYGYAQKNPASLLLIDVATGDSREVENFVGPRTKLQGAPVFPNLVWSPDGNWVTAVDFGGGCCNAKLVVYDLLKQERQVLHEQLPFPRGQQVAWHPDRQAILLYGFGETMIVPLSAEPPIQVQVEAQHQAFWDDRGERILTMTKDWQGLFVYHIQSGERTPLGDGWPVGWEGDSVYLIRWGASDERYMPPVDLVGP